MSFHFIFVTNFIRDKNLLYGTIKMLKLFNHIATQLVTCTMHDIVASSLKGIK